MQAGDFPRIKALLLKLKFQCLAHDATDTISDSFPNCNSYKITNKHCMHTNQAPNLAESLNNIKINKFHF